MRGLVQGFFYNNPDNCPSIINSVRLLIDEGWKVELYCRGDRKNWNVAYPNDAKIARIAAEPAAGSWREYLGFVSRAVRQGNRESSFFVGHDMHGFVPAYLLAVRHRRPLLYCCYDYTENGFGLNFGSRIVKSFQSRFARRADIVTVPDIGLAGLLKRDLRLQKDPLVVANSPIKRATEGGALHRELAARQRTFGKIIFRQGRVGPGHGIEATIRSIPLWKRQDWGFVVMGIADAAFVESVQRLAVEVGVQDRFVVLPPVSYDTLAQFTPDADLGHALYEPVHVNNQNISGACKVHEYMAAGVPLLVSRQPTLRSLIEKYECGLAADENSSESIAASVNSLLCDDKFARRLGDAGRRAFQEVFCYERQLAPLLKQIEEILARPRSSNPEAELLLNG